MVRLLVLAMACLCAGTVRAAEDPAPLDRARAALAEGRLDEADDILAAARAELVDRNDLDFLRGAAALARADYDAAIAAFRAILARDPSLNRVRLELARVLFLARDDEAAQHHFRIAQAAGLPPEVQAKVDDFLNRIKRRKRWQLDLALGVAPDSNVNAATTSRTVDLHGIPFTLDDNARKTSGIGVAANVGGSVQADLGPDSRLVAGGRIATMEYSGDRFDDRTLSAHLGPRFLIGAASEVTVSAIGSRRWYGGEGYSHAAGGRVEGQAMLDPRWLLGGSASVQRVTHDHASALDGPVLAGALNLTYGIDQASFVRGDVAVMREQARAAGFRATQFHVGASYYRELPAGFGISLGVGLTAARYDSPLAAFGISRHDDSLTTRMAVSNRRLDLFGFTPVIAWVHTERMSNIDLFDFARDRVELTLTRNF